MSKQILIRDEAATDLAEAKVWYQSQRSGLELELAASIEATLARITRHPAAYQPVFQEIRRAQVRRFPYAIYYVDGENHIAVLAIMHTSRHPRRWQERA